MIWTTKDGREIEIVKMSQNHLINAINFLERRIKEHRSQLNNLWNISYRFHGEIASMYIDQQLDDEADYISSLQLIQEKMKEELKIRQQTNNYTKLVGRSC